MKKIRNHEETWVSKGGLEDGKIIQKRYKKKLKKIDFLYDA